MGTSTQYGILTENSVRALFENINARPRCSECRSARIEFQERDKKRGEDGQEHFGIIIPGFSSVEVSPLEIMIIADSIGGGRSGDFREETSVPLQEAVHYLGDYYLNQKISRFHQYEMRKLFNWLATDFKKNWIFTDLIKCFVRADEIRGKTRKTNMEMAIQHCSKYLDDQIKELKPRVILILGKRIAKHYCNLNSKEVKQLAHGQLRESSTGGKDFKFIYSVFPSMRTADIWVRDIDTRGDDPWRPVKKALIDCLSNRR